MPLTLKPRIYDAEWNDKGSRVLTNMSNMPCPRFQNTVEANVEHLCGDRAPKTKPERGATPGRRKKQNTPGVRK